MPVVTVSSRGQVVIPAELRERLGIVAGTRVEFVADGAGLRLRVVDDVPRSTVEDGYGMFEYRGSPHRLSEFYVAAAMRKSRR